MHCGPCLARRRRRCRRQSAEAFTQKVALIQRQSEAGSRTPRVGPALTQDELNSWLVYRSQPHLPTGVSAPEVTIVGEGQLSGNDVVDLEASRSGGRRAARLDPWSLIGGQVCRSALPASCTPATARDGSRCSGRDVRHAGAGALLQEVLTYYSRSPERPQGVRLDDMFTLPANIRQIEVGQGQAVVVQ